MDTINYMVMPGIKEAYRHEFVAVINEELIVNAVCQHYNVTPDELKTVGRERGRVLPRQVAMYLMIKHGRYGVKHVGNYFGKDHSTAVHSKRHINDLLDTEPSFKAEIQKIETAFYGKSKSIKDCHIRRRRTAAEIAADKSRGKHKEGKTSGEGYRDHLPTQNRPEKRWGPL